MLRLSRRNSPCALPLDLSEILRWLSRDDVDRSRAVCRLWLKELRAKNDTLPLRRLEGLVVVSTVVIDVKTYVLFS